MLRVRQDKLKVKNSKLKTVKRARMGQIQNYKIQSYK